MSTKLESKEATVVLGGVERIVQLFAEEPHPADAFIPKNDALNLLLRFSITKEERRSPRPIRALKKKLNPKIGFSNKMCNVDYRLTVADGMHWFVVKYHVSDYPYGETLYEEISNKFFKN